MSGAVITDLERLQWRLRVASYRLDDANKELHAAEVAHRLASEALEEFEPSKSKPHAEPKT